MLPSVSQLCQAEVQNFGIATVRNENVGGLDVAMDYAFPVCGVKAIGHLDRKIHYLFERQTVRFRGSSRNALTERLPMQQLHGDKGCSFVLGDFINCANVGMVRGRSSTSFAPEPLQCNRVGREFLGQEFERYAAAEFQVLCLV